MPRQFDRTRRSIQLIQRSLRALEKGLAGLAAAAKGTGGGASAGTRRSLKLSPEVRALRKLQGSYMGYLRSLKPRDKARVKALRAEKGYPAAVELAKKLASA